MFTNRTSAPHGDIEGVMNPLSLNSCNCFLNSSNSRGAMRYGDIDIGFVWAPTQ
ncbi:hypothetical protein Syun_022725 [Stephania yunnanensis]|uniref:Uncharacterized protein n=1 Tax=Stephania yunnanensis TaxID=152371 RepID=A0AAP0F884_9MAGN